MEELESLTDLFKIQEEGVEEVVFYEDFIPVEEGLFMERAEDSILEKLAAGISFFAKEERLVKRVIIAYESDACKAYSQKIASSLKKRGISVSTFSSSRLSSEVSYTLRYQKCALGLYLKANQVVLVYDQEGYLLDEKRRVDLLSFIEGSLLREKIFPSKSEEGRITYLSDDPLYDFLYLDAVRNDSYYKDFFFGGRLSKFTVYFADENERKFVPMLLKNAGYQVRCLTDEEREEMGKTPKAFPREYPFILLNDREEQKIYYLNSKGKYSTLKREELILLLADFALDLENRRGHLNSNSIFFYSGENIDPILRIADAHKARVILYDEREECIKSLRKFSAEQEVDALFLLDEKGMFLHAAYSEDILEFYMVLSDLFEYNLRRGKTLDIVLKELYRKIDRRVYSEEVMPSLPKSALKTLIYSEDLFPFTFSAVVDYEEGTLQKDKKEPEKEFLSVKPQERYHLYFNSGETISLLMSKGETKAICALNENSKNAENIKVFKETISNYKKEIDNAYLELSKKF